MTKLAFVTNICPHYRVRTFEILAKYYPTKFYFFSAGKEWYWQTQHGVEAGGFDYEYVHGIQIGYTRITPALIFKLLFEQCDVFVKCINGRFALPITFAIARLRRKPFVLWTGVWMTLNTSFHRLIFRFTRYIYRNSDAVVVYGEHVKRYLCSQGVSAEKIFVAAHAVDNTLYSRHVNVAELQQLREKLRISDDQRVVLYLGRLEPSKGLTFLVEAFQKLVADDAVLILAGDGTEKSRLQRCATKLGVADRVRFPGYVSPRDAPPFYSLAYVFVLPSITTDDGKETWGLVVNEAMNQGCPVITTDAVGAAAGGLVQNGSNGVVVSERNSEELAAALQRLFDDPNLRHRLGDAARNKIFAWDNEQMVLGFCRAVNYVTGQNDEVTGSKAGICHASI